MPSSSDAWLMAAVSGASAVLNLLVYVVFAVVAFGVVRRHRPDVWGLVAGWALASIALQLLRTVTNFVVPAALAGGDSGSVFAATTVSMACFSLLGAAVDLLLVLAVVRRARGGHKAAQGDRYANG